MEPVAHDEPGRRALGALPAAKIRGLIRDQLKRVLTENGLSQEDLAIQIGYAEQSSISKLLRDRDLPRSKAEKLDQLFESEIGFVALLDAVTDAERRTQARRAGAVYDIFFASPMASADTRYGKVRNRARNLVNAIENHTSLTVYFAGRNIPSVDDFESADLAWRANRDALERSRAFVLYVTDTLTKPSSVWVEAGMALALELPSFYFVPDSEALPYILQRAVQPSAGGGSEIAIPQYFGRQKEKPHHNVRVHGINLFAGYL